MEKHDLELINCIGGNHPAKQIFINSIVQSVSDRKIWIEELRLKGFKAAHPNDGWVNRTDNYILLTYPQFNDGLNIGDLLMIGRHDNVKTQRPVRVISITNVFSLKRYYFEDINQPKLNEKDERERY